jgi:hypothetical protein
MDAIDRHGSDLSRWTDGGLASEVRAGMLADRQLRRYLEGAAALDDGLARVRDALDREVAASGALARISAAVMTSLPSRRSRTRWVAVAAGLVIAAGLGSAFDFGFLAPADQAPVEVVVLDPLVFGPTEVEPR